ncbi:MAG: tetraacyldisaccharide 4'-kinase [Candidatus Omnitrophota bacterium]|nr:tetraacyldisaccharide 4'-kinase [Candidatus Omnitrophota bacterium]
MSDKIRAYFYSLMSDKRQGLLAAAVKLFFSLISFCYYCGVEFIKFLYRLRLLKSYRCACKVVSVGNITLGGTGKTPLVVTLAGYLNGSGKKVAVLSRGYGGDRVTSDEVELLKKRLPGVPVLVGRDRIKTAREADESLKADVILLDDGFQHWRLKRDLDIVTLDINNPFGNGRLIPRGTLREPLSSLKRADIFVLTKVGFEGDSIAKAQGLKARLGVINADAAVFTSSYIPSRLFDVAGPEELKLSFIDNKKIVLVCAIGDPESFEDTAKALGADIVLRFFFMDHHKYTGEELGAIIKECEEKGIDIILTTEKDVPRLVDSPQSIVHSSKMRFLALGIEMKIDNEEKFFGRLYSIFNS